MVRILESSYAEPETQRMDATFIVDLAIIVAIAVLVAVIVNPIGEFPLDDDWSFSRTVAQLLDTHEYRPAWANMTLLSNILWGSLFCLPAGFSFTALRLSTLCASLLGTIGVYVLVRDISSSRLISLAATLTLAFNPVYCDLSYTFMTDVPFAAVSIWAVVFFARSLKRRSPLHMVIGTLLAIVATLSRDLGLCIPLAYGLIAPSRSRLARQTVVMAATPLAVCLVPFFILNYWLTVTGRISPTHDLNLDKLIHSLRHPGDLVTLLLMNIYVSLVHLGLFSLPVLVLAARSLLAPQRKGFQVILALGLSAMAAGALIRLHFGDGILIPMSFPADQIIFKSGLGTPPLRDIFLLRLDHLPAMPRGLWIGVTALAFVGALMLLRALSMHATAPMDRLVHRERLSDQEVVGTFLLICGLIYQLPFLISWSSDRYIMPSVVFFAAGLLALSGTSSDTYDGAGKLANLTAATMLVAFGVFSVGATRDFMMWNRLRWQALTDLTQKDHVDRHDIDGGYEFNGWYLYDPNYKPDIDPRQTFAWADPHVGYDPGRSVEPGKRSFWWVYRDTYQISFGDVPGYETFREYSYKHWLPPHVQKILILRKQSSPESEVRTPQ